MALEPIDAGSRDYVEFSFLMIVFVNKYFLISPHLHFLNGGFIAGVFY